MAADGQTVLVWEFGERTQDHVQLLGRRHPPDGDHPVRIARTRARREDLRIDAVAGDDALCCRNGHAGGRRTENFFDQAQGNFQRPAFSARFVPEVHRFSEEDDHSPGHHNPDRRHVHKDRVVLLAMTKEQPPVSENLRESPFPRFLPEREDRHIRRQSMMTHRLPDHDHARAMLRELRDPPVEEPEDGIGAVDLLSNNQ